jgi:hypothetical protein
MGASQVSATLKESQQGEITLYAARGMVLKSDIRLSVKGTIRVMEMEIPITMKTRINSEGKKL